MLIIKKKPIYIINEIHPLLEIKRGCLFKLFVSHCKRHIFPHISNEHKKSSFFNSMIIRLFFSIYIDYQKQLFMIDPFLPNYVRTLKGLELDMQYIYHDHSSIQSIIQSLELPSLLKKLSKEMYINFNHLALPDSYVLFERQPQHLVLRYNSFEITVQKQVYTNLKSKFIHRQNVDFYKLLWCLFYRYQIFDHKNQHLSIHPKVLSALNRITKIDGELFASAFNSYFPVYCSVYYDIEQYFGSQGSFFNADIDCGVYTCNPPYDLYMLYKTTKKLLKHLRHAKGNLLFYVFIPIWDNKGKQELLLEPSPIDNYKPIEMIEKSEFLQYKKLIRKSEITFYDYMECNNVYVSNTYFLILANYEIERQPYEDMNFCVS